MSTFVCVCVCVCVRGGGCWISDRWRCWGVTTASGWLAAVFWSALVRLAPHALLTSVSVFPTPSSCTKHRQASPERHEYVSYPTSEQYMNMANAVLTSFPAILRNSDLEEHEMQLQWKLRIQCKFQNSRKRQDSSVTEVTSRKKKIPCIAPKETTCPLMYGVKANLSPRLHSEDDESLERHRQWLALHWMKKDPELDKIIKEFLRLEPQADEPDPRVAVLKGLEKYRLLIIAILKKRKAVPLYMETLLELYDHDESQYACLVILGLLHLLGERKDSIFTKIFFLYLSWASQPSSVPVTSPDKWGVLLTGLVNRASKTRPNINNEP
ncbi:uncharacterized protein LOC135107391 isoform X1 [Scylla paramamosain]|uniref:uncharacterized protein LOC135107391 isoform X1 n=2 Tax=Scylla paramamosain TaxID=85552 RepID=UPI003082F14D